jgi:integrase
VSSKTQAGAIAKLQEAQSRTRAGLPAPDRSLTVAAQIRRWLASLEGRVTPNTIDNYETVARLHIIPTLGQTRLAKLTPQDVGHLLVSKGQDGYSVSTVRRIRAMLVQAIKQAERWGLVGRNVAALTEGPRAAKREGRSLTPDEARRLLTTARGVTGWRRSWC